MELRYLIIFLLTAFISTSPMNGACPGSSPSEPRVAWDRVVWSYYGSLPETGIYAAASAWNAVLSFTEITSYSETPGIGFDVFVSDDSGLTGLGEQQSFGNGSGSSSCYLKRSSTCNNMCFNESKLYYATIKLNPTAINSVASSWGVSQANVVKFTMSHELGHVFNLNNSSDTGCTGTSIMSVNQAFPCGFYGPQSCDASVVASVYASPWTVYQWSVCGPTCNLETSCTN